MKKYFFIPLYCFSGAGVIGCHLIRPINRHIHVVSTDFQRHYFYRTKLICCTYQFRVKRSVYTKRIPFVSPFWYMAITPFGLPLLLLRVGVVFQSNAFYSRIKLETRDADVIIISIYKHKGKYGSSRYAQNQTFGFWVFCVNILFSCVYFNTKNVTPHPIPSVGDPLRDHYKINNIWRWWGGWFT